MMLEGLDVQNLVALHVLIEERHVTRAARRLGLSQSSMSHRLRRLRETFGDPLFVRSGGKLLLTPRAAALAEPLARALGALEAVVEPATAFDPKTTRMSLSVAMPDLLAPLAPQLIGVLTREAPDISLRLVHVPSDLGAALARGEPAFAFAPAGFAPDHIVARAVGELRFGVVGRRGHPAFKGKWTTSRWLAFAHVVVRIGNERANIVGEELTRRGLNRKIGLEVPSFLAGLHAVAHSNFLMNAPAPLVDSVAPALRLVRREAPLPLPRVRFALLWHERFTHDRAHRWARELSFATVQSMF